MRSVRARPFLAAAVLFVASQLCLSTLGAQSAPEHVALGDADHSALRTASALRHYEAAIASDPKAYEALYKAAREAVSLGESETNSARRSGFYRNGELYARRAVEVNPRDAEGHFHLARAVGRIALSVGKRERVKYAGEVRAHALEALKYDPRHPGALHVMGVWNAEVMRLSGISRMIAKNFLGGQVFSSASWAEAVRYMEQAVAVEPDRITHRLDLAMIYRDIGNKAKARQHFEHIVRMALQDPADAGRKREAEQALRSL